METLNPNCSETVIRLKLKDAFLSDREKMRIFEMVIRENFGRTKSAGEEYSTMRPRDNSETCFYFYQHDANAVELLLRAFDIKYEAHHWMTTQDIIDDTDDETLKLMGAKLVNYWKDALVKLRKANELLSKWEREFYRTGKVTIT